MNKLGASLAALVLGCGLFPHNAAAQSDDAFRRDRNQSVRDRPKPEYEAPGVPAGGFRFYPEIALLEDWTDNVFATASNEKTDTSTILQTRARLKSLWSTHALNLSFTSDSSFYARYDQQNTTDWTLGADGRLDIVRGFYVSGGLSYADRHEALASTPTALTLAEPVPYTEAAAQAAVVKRFNRLELSGQARISKFDYDNAPILGGGTLIEDDRDRTIRELGARADYAISPDTSLFFSLTGNWRDYRLDPPSVSVLRDSSGLVALAGANFDLTHLIRGEVGLGYLQQSYDAPGVKDTSGLAARASVEWFIDPLVTITMAADREVEDAGAAGAAGYITTGVSLDVDYEYRRNIVLGLSAGYSQDDYNVIDRNDERSRLQGRVEYLANRDASVVFELSRFTQDSSGLAAGRTYDADRVMIGLRLRR